MRNRNNNLRGRLDVQRVLSSEDFELIQKLLAARAERSRDPRLRSLSKGHTAAGNGIADADCGDKSHAASRKRTRAQASDGDEKEDDEEGQVQHARGDADFAVDPTVLAPGMKTDKSTKIDKMMQVLSGRSEVRFEHEGHRGGLTNKEKLRKKNFVMVRKGKRSVATKSRKSNSEMRYSKSKRKEIYGRDVRKRRRV